MKPEAPAPNVLPILWGSFLMTQALFVGLTFVIPPAPAAGADWAPLLGLPALVAAGLAVEGGLLRRWAPAVQTWYILRFALAEAAGLMGLVSWFVTGERLVQLGCAGLAVVALLVSFPTERAAGKTQGE